MLTAAIVTALLVLVLLGVVLASVALTVRTLRDTNQRLGELRDRLMAVEEQATPLGEDVEHLERELSGLADRLRGDGESPDEGSPADTESRPESSGPPPASS